jgi:16S rRNA (guanine966-N2)-methyltransferase
MSIRITGGFYKGRQVRVSAQTEVRPTASRVREAFFSIVHEGIHGSHFLDLFGGSGIMGLEALSRGAEKVTICEKNHKVMKVIIANVRALGAESSTRVLRTDAARELSRGDMWDIVYMDPPYSHDPDGWLEKAFNASRDIIAIEHSAQVSPSTVSGEWSRDRIRKYGETALSIYFRG